MKYDPRSFLCEPGSTEGSCHRLLLFLLVLTVLILVSMLTVKTGKLPEVPSSLETLVEWVGGIITTGIFGGKFVKAFGKQPEGGGNVATADTGSAG